ncbi:MAG: alkanesulfonate monooxygenase SsuD [Parasphingorhabdus sp.]|jgi:alkanesulfonate monooxygenase SsuD/methylene tetrahydromethanopterin reductase-like flavin-dependent oxidoreductase (luciferase family)
MKFSIAINMNRFSANEKMTDVVANTTEMVKMADQGGMEAAWASEHHCIEMTIAPNPFLQLTHWAQHTSNIRLGTAVICAPYWHPIRAAEEAALVDLYSDGRLELGLARGAFQYEFDRMAKGVSQKLDGGEYLYELLPALKALWAGDYQHDGRFWQFPNATAVPKPLQTPHPPLWTAARGQDTFDWAVENDLNVMSTPLQMPFSEVEDLARKLKESLEKNPGKPRPRWLVLRSTCIYDDASSWRVPVDAARYYSAQFQGLFQTGGEVINGFPKTVNLEQNSEATNFDAETLWQSMLFGTPEQAVEKLKDYEEQGVDQFCYGANFGLDAATSLRSLELFITRVMPHFT